MKMIQHEYLDVFGLGTETLDSSAIAFHRVLDEADNRRAERRQSEDFVQQDLKLCTRSYEDSCTVYSNTTTYSVAPSSAVTDYGRYYSRL